MIVFFWGAIYEPEEIAKFYKNVKVTVIPAAIGLTAIQSLAYGVPVITDDGDFDHGPEVDAIVSGLTGDRYPAGDAELLADTIEKWVNKVSEQPGEVTANCINEFKHHWTPQVQAERMFAVIRGQ